ncbi:MAG TPA: ribosomal protein S18-alanine N-acetyltransferase [Pyrinomonadaceae bacterium]|jgi:ribosomal-protein-alanine N-acetyltransferase|nr:ribosomal protein S18-alanine N-acetyltransferase [Pyrinomonadaceae bacterium]
MSGAKRAVGLRQTDCVIGPMTEHDLLEVVEIEASCELSLWGWDAYRTELARAEALMLVARRLSSDESGEMTLSGFIAARVTAGEMHINNVGVLEVFRGQGVGSLLLDAAMSEATHRGGRVAILEVRASNTAAQSLYRRHGFNVTGRRQKYYRNPTEDALVMCATLE